MTKGKLARDDTQKPFARDLVTEFVNQVLEQGTVVSKDTVAFINQRILELDDLIANQLNEIMHDPAFQKLEGSWRGLSYLVMNTETGVHLKLRLMNITKKELLDDLEKAVEFDQSQMFKKIYEEEYGTFGGHPYSCLVGDFEFTRHPQDMELLQKISQVAAAAHAPFLTAADPKLFDLDSFEHLGVPRDLAKIFESLEMIKWNSFRETEDSRYVAMLLPRVLMRLPYGANTLPAEGLNFEEDVAGADTSKFCWTNPAYILGQRITNAFSLYKWTAAIRGVEGGGIVEGLPAYTFKTTDGDIALKCPTETSITDRREKELSDLGFISLCHCKGTDYAAFFGGQTTQKPKVYNLEDANANANLSARLPYILAASRFAHYIKVIMRDKIGSFLTRDNVEKYLNTWIASYVVINDNASQPVKAKFPLREARIDVYDVPGKPGSYRSVIYLRPHFQMEELTASIRMVATLPPPAAQ
jgi:type VI secretion system protein ImpC